MKNLSADNDRLVLIGVEAFSNEGDSKRVPWISDTIQLGIEQNFALRPGVIIMEHRAAALLNDEQNPTEEPPPGIKISKILITGTYLLDKSSTDMGVTCKLKCMKGDNIILKKEFKGPAREASQIAIKAVQFIYSKLLKSTPIKNPMSSENEAKLFEEQADFLIDFEEYEKAIPLLESAIALQPDKFATHAKMVNCINGQLRKFILNDFSRMLDSVHTIEIS